MTEAKEDNIVDSGVLYMRLGENFGQFFTDFVREIAWDDCKRDTAVMKVLHALHGISVEDAEAVVDGKKRFVTMDDGIHVDMVDDNWTPPDLEAIRTEAVDYAKEVLGLRFTRKIGGNWFTFLPEADQLNLQLDAQFVLSMADENPRKARNLKRNLERACRSAMLSHSEEFVERRAEVRARREMERSEGGFDDIYEGLKADAIARIAQSDALSPDMKERLIRVTDGIVDAHKNGVEVIVDAKFEYDTGWLNRDGLYFGCKPGQHIPLAHTLIDKFFAGKEGDAEQGLEGAGWMKCTGKEWWTTEKPPTPEQKRAIVDWAKVHGQKIKWDGTETTVRELKEEGVL